MFKLQKATDLINYKGELPTDLILSKKFDGFCVVIKKISDKITFETSNGKQFFLNTIAEGLLKLSNDFILIGEYLYNSDGKLGSRKLSAKLTTLRTNYNKGLDNDECLEEKSKIVVFDCIPIVRGLVCKHLPFEKRLNHLRGLDIPKQLQVIKTHKVFSVDDAKGIVSQWVKAGWEGGMCHQADAPYIYGKRVKHCVKIKARPTADLKCIGIEYGRGKYKGLIGALVLRDDDGRVVNCGSGLTDEQRALPVSNFIGKTIEIGYEKVSDDTYIQPTFKYIREDKQ